MSLKIKNLNGNYILIASLFILFSVMGKTEVITIDEFLQTMSSSQAVTESFSYDCPGKYYSSTYNSNYLAITLSQQKTIENDQGSENIYAPYCVKILDARGILLSLFPEVEKFRIAGFIENETDFYVFEQGTGEEHDVSIYDIEGNFVNHLNCGNFIFNSPGGKFYYHSGLESASLIYNENGNVLFNIPKNGSQFIASATSDSTLLVLDDNSLSFWNINTQTSIWEKDIPSKKRFILDNLSHIQFSIQGNIIVLHSISGYYCFNFQGDYLWGEENYSVSSRILNYIGVSNSSGNIAVIYTVPNRPHFLFTQILDSKGLLLENYEINLGDNINFSGNLGSTANIFNNFISIPFTVRVEGQPKNIATCILYNENQTWNSAVVNGYWLFLSPTDKQQVIIGFDSISKQLRGYRIQ